MGIKFIVISVQVSHIIGYLEGFVKTINRVQVSISHTPEGTDTPRNWLKEVDSSTKIKDHVASVSSTVLCTTPVVIGGETR